MTSPSADYTGPATYRPVPVPASDTYLSVDNWMAPAVDAEGTAWIATTVAGWSGPPTLRLSSVERPRRHGVFDGATYYGGRTITVVGTAQAVSRAAAVRAMDIIASVCAWDSSILYPFTVVEPGQPTRRCMVRLAGDTKISAPYGGYDFDFQIMLLAPDPRRYSDAQTLISLALPTPGPTGLTFPSMAPLSLLGSGLLANRVTLTNAGTINTLPVVTVYGPVTNPTLGNSTTGQTLIFNIDIAAGEYLVVDFDTRAALLGGTAPRTYTIDPSSSWWELRPGGNDVVFTATAGTGTASIVYRSAWM